MLLLGSKNNLKKMFLKGFKIYSILKGTCPKCHEESMYKNKNPYQLSDALLMHKKCSNCQTTYKIEPSFFYGAMYVSYAVGIAFAIAAFVISYFFLGSNRNISFLSIVVTLIVFLPIILRLSRNIWINIFIHYDPIYRKK